MITISSDIVNIISANVASIISQLWVIFALLFGIILTFYILRKLVFLFSLAKR
jgi:hypothetical protein